MNIPMIGITLFFTTFLVISYLENTFEIKDDVEIDRIHSVSSSDKKEILIETSHFSTLSEDDFLVIN